MQAFNVAHLRALETTLRDSALLTSENLFMNISHLLYSKTFSYLPYSEIHCVLLLFYSIEQCRIRK